MRFLNTILRDARRPLNGRFRLQRSAVGEASDDGESPAPPLEEQEDGAMTVYRREKAGPPPSPLPTVPERGTPMGNTHVAGDAFPSAEPTAPHTETFKSPSHSLFDESIDFSVRDTRQPDRERDIESATPMSVFESSDASSPSDIPKSVGTKRSFSEPIHDPSDPALERSNDSVQDEAQRQFPRRHPGTGTAPYPSSDRDDALTANDQGEYAALDPTPTEPVHSDPASDDPVAAPPDGDWSPEAAAGEPRASASDSAPRVRIGQVDVTVVRNERDASSAVRPTSGVQTRLADKAASRRFLSRHYLRRL